MSLSSKQKAIFAFPHSGYDALICDGAIRSGKTLWMTVAFIDDAMQRFSNTRFGICGKTVDSALKNIVEAYLSTGIYEDFGYSVHWSRSNKILEVRRGQRVNRFEVFGGKDESSYMLIQGRTLAGVLLDEVALMPRSFVEQATSRCSVDGSKIWFNCNPEGQLHWFYQEWVKQPEKHNALRLHFTMEDNPGLSEAVRKRYERQYSGVFYDRYIRGLWVSAEGRIYDMFNAARHVSAHIQETEGSHYVSIDYGTQNPTVFLLWRKERGSERWICLREYYYSGREELRQKTDVEFADDLRLWLGDIQPRAVIVDPSAASFIAELRQRHFPVQQADNAVLDGIRMVGQKLCTEALLFSASCTKTIEEFGVYSWDETAARRGEDRPLKEHDHCMDAVRYFVNTILGRFMVAVGRRPKNL